MGYRPDLRVVLLILYGIAVPAQADGLFIFTGTVNAGTVNEQTSSKGHSRIDDLFDLLKESNLKIIFPSYTNTSQLDANLDVRGLPAMYSLAQDSPDILFEIPSLEVSMVFSGATRDESRDALEEYLKSNQSDLLTRMLQQLAATTATDPVAGNPNSLLATMGAADFAMGVDFASGGGSLQEAANFSNSGNSLGLGLRFGRYSASGNNQDVIHIPLSYTYRFESDPQRQLLFELPLSYSNTEGSRAYGASLGIGYRHPFNDSWSLTPALRAGGVGSEDLGAGAIVYSGSLTSNYNIFWDDVKISIGNMAGFYKTTGINTGGFNLDYDLSNWMFKNGLGFERPAKYIIFGAPTSWQFSVAHTFFAGDDLYVDSYVDFAFSFGTHATESVWDRLRLGATYTVGNNSFKGFQINLGYMF